MKECDKKHKTCQQYRKVIGPNSALPLRLINVDPEGECLRHKLGKTDIGLLSCETVPHVRVQLSKDIISPGSKNVQYLTLSHRWGDQDPTRLTSENMEEFSQQIPIRSLSTTFKDAIQITRSLGFRYLWIDSICINQADAVEKANEISRMHDIYSHSQLNLSATSAEEGLIFKRDPKSVLPIVKNKVETMISRADPISKETEEHLVISAGPWESFVDLGPLNRRAWVMQERLLAPSVLHLCYNMAYWECSSLRASEVDPLGAVDHSEVRSVNELGANIKSKIFTVSEDHDTAERHASSLRERLNLFYRIVRAYYLPSELTYPRDRLPAISGIAKWFMLRLDLTPTSYVAGFWKETLSECLLWHLRQQPSTDTVRDVEAAPSWSWASIVGTQNFPLSLGTDMHRMVDPHPLFQDLRTIVRARNGDRFAQLEFAALRLQVALIPVYRERDRSEDSYYMRLCGNSKWYKERHDAGLLHCETFRDRFRFYTYIIRCIGLLNTRSALKHRLLDSDVTASSLKSVQVRWDTSDMLNSDDPSSSPGQLYMVPMFWLSSPYPSWISGRVGFWYLEVRGLILQRLPGQGQYRRVGMFMTGNYGMNHNPELVQNILRNFTTKALGEFTDAALRQAAGNQRIIQSDLLARLSEGKRKMAAILTGNTVGPDDHLGTNDIGLYQIEVL